MAILYFTTVPVPITTGAGDKGEHLLAFLLLGLLARLGWPNLSYGRFWLPLLALFGGGIELVQHFLPYRSADLLDLLADIAGLLLAWSFTLLRRS